MSTQEMRDNAKIPAEKFVMGKGYCPKCAALWGPLYEGGCDDEQEVDADPLKAMG